MKTRGNKVVENKTITNELQIQTGASVGYVWTALDVLGNGQWSAPAVSSQWTNVTGGINYSGGNVGIGTTTPTAFTATRKALVISDPTNDAVLRLLGSSGVDVEVLAANGVGALGTRSAHPLSFFTNNSTTMTILSGGNVGIGTASPVEKFTVSGGGLLVTGSAGAGGGAGAFFDLFSDRARFFGFDYATGIFKDVEVNGTLFVAVQSGFGRVGLGNTVPTSRLDVDGGIIARGGYNGTSGEYSGVNIGDRDVAGPYTTLYGLSGSWRIYRNGADRISLLDNGNVGIGIANPVAKLDVFGNSVVSTSAVINDGIFNITASSTAQLKFGSYTFGPYGMFLQVKDTNNTGGTYPIILNPVGGGVSIGQQYPLSTFHVEGPQTTLDGLPALQTLVASSDTTKRMYFGYNATLGGFTINSVHTAVTWQPVIFSNSAIRAMGSVSQTAIGSSRLDLGVEAGTPRVVFEHGVSGKVWLVDNDSGTFRFFTPGVLGMSLAKDGSNNTIATIFDGSGNGTYNFDTTPTGYATIKGFRVSSHDLNSIYLNAPWGISSNVGLDWIRFDGAGAITFANGNAEKMRLHSNGNIGIGTTNPQAKVHTYENDVNGGLNFRLENDGAIGAFKYATLGQMGSNGYGISGWANATVLEGASSGGLVLGAYAGAVIFQTNNRTIQMTVSSTGNVGIGQTSPTAVLHLKAGTATANTAPLKLTTGTALTTPEDGSLEYHASHLYFTIGSTRYQLDQQSGGASVSRVSLTKSSPQALSIGTYTAITFDTEEFDTDTMHDNTNPSRITFTTAGDYLVTGHGPYISNNCAIELKFVVNGTTDYAEEIRNNTNGGNESISISFMKSFSAGDYVELYANSLSGNFNANPGCLFSAVKLG